MHRQRPVRPLILPPCLLAAVLLAACAGPARAPADPLLFLPADLDLVASVRFPDLVRGPIGERILASEETIRAIDRFASASGIDLRSDLHRLAVAAEWDPEGPGRFVAVAAGRFDRERLRGWLERNRAGGTSYRGVDLSSFLLPDGRGGEREIHAGLLRGPHLAVGDPELVAAVVDRADGIGAAVLGDPWWAERLEEVDPGSTIWGILTRESVLRGWGEAIEALRPGLRLGDPFSDLRSLSVEIRTPGAIEVRLWGDLGEPDRAEAVAGDLRAGLQILQNLAGERRPRIRELLGSVEVGTEGGRLRIDAVIRPEWIDGSGWWEAGPRQAAAGGQSAVSCGAALRSTSSIPSRFATRMLFSSR